MSTTFTTSSTLSFTHVHAVNIASKVAADLRLMQRFHGKPSDKRIEQYIEEIVILLLEDCLDSVVYGFKRNDLWVPGAALSYNARWGSMLADDSPGRIIPHADVIGATWGSFLNKNDRFFALPSHEQTRIENALPIDRTDGEQPGADGIWYTDKTYSSGNGGMERRILKPY